MRISLSDRAREELAKCFRCGYCRAWCPVFNVKQSESWGPRGRVLIIRAIARGALGATSSAIERLYSCSLCRACEVNCPPRVRYSALMSEMRSSLVKLGLAPPDGQRRLALEAVESGSIFGQKLAVPEGVRRLVEDRADVVFFMGCMANFRYQKHAECLALLLRKAGVAFSVLPEESCCGGPIEFFGMKSEFEKASAVCLEQLEKSRAQTVLTLCPMCYTTLKRICKERRVLHATQLLAEVLDRLPVRRLGLKAYYHDPCHLARYEGMVNEPRLALRSAGVELIEKKEEHCCGGPIRIPFIELRNALCGRILRNAEGAEAVVTACPTCYYNLSLVSTEIPVLDLCELLAYATGLVDRIPVYEQPSSRILTASRAM